MENQNPVHVFATWKVKEGQIENVLHLLKTVHKESIKEDGNLFYKIHQSNSDRNTIVLFEGYKDESSIAEHRNSKHFQDLVLGKIVPLLENREIVLTTPIEY
ncbi:Quinol monooxygenase YgiN [Flavobacterium aquidurense]|uniref:Antibiotic biosynthesis monooxygenase n=1 Tax=Flavobacterium frigidimaris TaxID=262320 RepID=A0ABX4BR62_FLAFR|nr:putative quinol monooxygenase [Flavobacterium frigidimaris]OXA79065.1 antibiotic biosynthesis monooxygenase [Flavobacterium frigidimaris]SDY80657.1 Quinol monooxygenase YgiN [Flavobacterium aquidurense]